MSIGTSETDEKKNREEEKIEEEGSGIPPIAIENRNFQQSKLNSIYK